MRVPGKYRSFHRKIRPRAPNDHGHIVRPGNQQRRVFVPTHRIHAPAVFFQVFQQPHAFNNRRVFHALRLRALLVISRVPLAPGYVSEHGLILSSRSGRRRNTTPGGRRFFRLMLQ